MPSAWITHVKSVYAAGRKKDSSYKYKNAMMDAKKTYKKKGAAAASEEPEAAPKKRRARKKKSPIDVKSDHTAGLGNVDEGKLAEKAQPKKKRRRQRPSLGKRYVIKN